MLDVGKQRSGEALEHGSVHLIKRNKAAAVVLHWLLEVPPSERPRRKAAIDTALLSERDW